MSRVDLSYAQNHLLELLERVQNGEKLFIMQGSRALAKLMPIRLPEQIMVNKIVPKTPPEQFAPLSDAEIAELGIEEELR